LKYKRIASLLKRRIAAGDYAINTFPGEVQLAGEMGVSRRTIRLSLQLLMDEGLLTRAPSRRLVVNRSGDHPGARKVIGFLAPCFASLHSETWRIEVERAARARNLVMRTVDYMHDDDSVITDALEGLDGVFVVLGGASGQHIWQERLKTTRVRAVVIDFDLSAAGIVSIVLHPPRWIEMLLDHLRQLGHRSIDCLNVQPIDTVITRRIAVWRNWCDHHRIEGHLVGQPVPHFVNPYSQAVTSIGHYLEEDRAKATALLCTTEAGAMGAARALTNKGLAIGRDISICCANEEALARYFIPSLTTLAAPDRQPSIHQCLDWMQGRHPWDGPKLMEPPSPTLFHGESTGPPRK
jgi:DNA-binding LacI/PurR family transcriptional regulator